MKIHSLRSRLLAAPLLAVLVFLSGCAGGSVLAGSSWPGITVADPYDIYLAYHKVYSVDNNGKMRWVFPATLASGQAFFAPPAISRDLVVVADYTDSIFGLDPATGKQLWMFKSPERTRFVGGAIIGDKYIYAAGTNGVVHALNRGDGTEAWRFPAEGAKGSMWGAPLLDGKTLYVSSLDRHIYALDAETGQLQWEFPEKPEDAGDPPMGPIVTTPALHDGVLYFGSFNYYVYALDTATRQVRWKYRTARWVWSSPVYDGADKLLIGADLDGNVFALHPEDGAKAWSRSLKVPVVGAPLLAKLDDGTPVVYVTLGTTTIGEKNLYVLKTTDGTDAIKPQEIKATIDAYFLFFKTSTDDRTTALYAPPVAAGNLLLFGQHEGTNQLYAADSKTLERVWAFNGTQAEQDAKTASGQSSDQGGLLGNPQLLNTLLIISMLFLVFTLLTGRRQGSGKK